MAASSPHNRADVVDQQFSESVRAGRLPQPRAHKLQQYDGLLTSAELADLFESQVLSRHTDLAARWLKGRGESYYTIGSAGHEGNAGVAYALRPTDLAFLHYRSGGFYVARAKQVPGQTPVWDLMLSLAASADDPIAGGRHKVFGSVPLCIPPQTSTIASHLPKSVGAAMAIPRAKDLGVSGRVPEDSLVVCSFGDASFNHATAQSAINAASLIAYQNLPLPLLFVCEDNGIGISVPTPDNWIAAAAQSRPSLRYFHCDGRDIEDVVAVAQEAEDYVRRCRRPAFLHMQTVRLLGHAGSDVEALYHAQSQIEASERDDPLLHTARRILDRGCLSADEIINLYESVRQRVRAVAEQAIVRPKLETPAELMTALVPQERQNASAPQVPASQRKETFGFDIRYMERPQHMAKLLNWALHDLLLQYPQAVVFGEDVAKKGGVYHVTANLAKRFGSRRVFNSPLDETSILGTAIGLAHNNILPIPEIQFLAYVHNAEDQLRGEAATLSYFSQGQFTNPMVVRIAGLAYQKGFGGHFHNDNSLAVFRDLPGVVLACPSNGADAVRMLRTAVRLAHEEGRVVVFLEPIALYMTKDLVAEGDGGWSFLYPEPGEEAVLGEFAVHDGDGDTAIITYGNGTYLSMQAAHDVVERGGKRPRIIDLRWLSEVDEVALAAAVADKEHVLIVDECRRTGSQSEAIVTALVEQLGDRLPTIERITADDCFIPLGKAATVLLPQRAEIAAAVLAAKTKGKGTVTGRAAKNSSAKRSKPAAKKTKTKKRVAGRGR